MNFDPMTGEPLNNQGANAPQPIEMPTVPIEQVAQTVEPQQPIMESINPEPTTNNIAPTESQTVNMMQNVATVNQTQENFINNVQNENKVNEEKKADGPNYWFIIILFIIIFAAIFFLFPYLLKTF